MEVTNRTLLMNLKTRLEKSKGGWIDYFPTVLLAYHTMARIPTCETPFSLVYRTKAIIPVEIQMPIFFITNFNKSRWLPKNLMPKHLGLTWEEP